MVEMNDVLRQVDFFLTPTSPVVAWGLGESGRLWERITDVVRALASFTAPFNLTAIPPSRSHVGCPPRGYPSVCRSPGGPSTRRQCSVSPTPTSRPRHGWAWRARPAWFREGKLADILILDSDPLTHITVLQDKSKMPTLIKAGRQVHLKASLPEVELEGAEHSEALSPNPPKDVLGDSP